MGVTASIRYRHAPPLEKNKWFASMSAILIAIHFDLVMEYSFEIWNEQHLVEEDREYFQYDPYLMSGLETFWDKVPINIVSIMWGISVHSQWDAHVIPKHDWMLHVCFLVTHVLCFPTWQTCLLP